jgi:hypothetical protein
MEVDVEQRASELGWTSKEAWVEKGGNEDRWRNADEFLAYGEQNTNFVRKSLEKDFDKKLADATKDFDDRVAKLENVTSSAITAAAEKSEEQRQNLVKRWTAHRTKAADDDDLTEYNKADIALKALEGKAPQTVNTQPDNGPSSESTAFHTKLMPLINQSTAVQKFADDAAITIRRDNPNIAEADYFKELETRIGDKFGDDYPQFFGRQTKRPPAVDSSDGNAGESKNSFSDLPPEAKEAFKEFSEFMTKEQYLADYFGE